MRQLENNEYIFKSEMNFACASVSRVDHGYNVIRGSEYIFSL